jgi:hypothetical protein
LRLAVLLTVAGNGPVVQAAVESEEANSCPAIGIRNPWQSFRNDLRDGREESIYNRRSGYVEQEKIDERLRRADLDCM